MGDNAAGYNVTYSTIGNRENLTDILTNISPTATPFFSSIGSISASNTLVEWQTDELPTAIGTNAKVEGASADIASASVTTRETNRTQIFDKVVAVSNTQIDGMNTAGRENEWSYQMRRMSMATARDIEFSMVQNSASVSAGAGVAARLKGLGLGSPITGEASASLLGWLSGNVAVGSTGIGSGDGHDASGRATLTETIFNDLLQAIWNNGGRPNMILTGGYLRRVISSFSANATRYASVPSSSSVLNASVSIYESDFGMVEMRLDNFIGATRIGAIETQYFKAATLRPLTFSRLAKDGDREKGQFVTELTLVAMAPKSSGMITSLASASGANAGF